MSVSLLARCRPARRITASLSSISVFGLVALLALALSGTGCGSADGGPATGRQQAAKGKNPGGRRAGGPGNQPGQGPGKPGDAIPVHTAAVRLEPLSSLYSTSATLRADKQAIIKSRTRGVIQELLVEEGDRVATDQPLARLENDEQQIAAQRARVVYEIRQGEFARTEKLHKEGMVSVEEFETRRRELEEAEQESALRDLELSRTIIRAPFGGIIVRRHLDVGANVSDGTDVYEIADLNPLYADVNIPERHVIRLGVNQTVRLTADATGEVVEARIERIAPSVDPATGTVKVTLAIQGHTSLRPGAFVRVSIVTDTHHEAIVVPRTALVAEGRRWHLFRLDREGETVEQLEVALGYEEGNRIEIIDVIGDEPLLEPGQEIVSEGAPALTDGARVRVMEPEDSGAAGEPLVAR